MVEFSELVAGILVLGTALVVAAWSTILTARFARGGAVMESMIQRSFLPEKQRTYLRLLSIEGSMVLNVGIVWGLGTTGILPSWAVTALVAIFLVIGATSVGAVTWLGLRPSQLTAPERVALRNRALQSLLLLPWGTEAA